MGRILVIASTALGYILDIGNRECGQATVARLPKGAHHGRGRRRSAATGEIVHHYRRRRMLHPCAAVLHEDLVWGTIKQDARQHHPQDHGGSHRRGVHMDAPTSTLDLGIRDLWVREQAAHGNKPRDAAARDVDVRQVVHIVLRADDIPVMLSSLDALCMIFSTGPRHGHNTGDHAATLPRSRSSRLRFNCLSSCSMPLGQLRKHGAGCQGRNVAVMGEARGAVTP